MTKWRYLRRGRVRHAISDREPVDAAKLGLHVSECGSWALPSDNWYGTGSQEEYERAATLPVCQRCKAALTGRRG